MSGDPEGEAGLWLRLDPERRVLEHSPWRAGTSLLGRRCQELFGCAPQDCPLDSLAPHPAGACQAIPLNEGGCLVYRGMPAPTGLLEQALMGFLSPLLAPRRFFAEPAGALREVQRCLGARRLEFYLAARSQQVPAVLSTGPASGGPTLERVLSDPEGALLGRLVVEWTEPAELQRATSLLNWIGETLGSTLHWRRLALTRQVERQLHPAADLDTLLERATECLLTSGQASHGSLVLFDTRGPGHVMKHWSSQPGRLGCAKFHEPCLERCALLAGRVDHTRESDPRSCSGVRLESPFVTGFGLRFGGQLRGVALLAYQRQPEPPERYLPDLSVVVQVLEHQLEARFSSLWPGGEEVPAPPRRNRPLFIRCFGRFELELDGQPLPLERFRRRQSLIMLRLLLLQDGSPIPADRLAELMWPDVEPSVSASRLYVVVHDLRRALRDSHTREFVLGDRSGYPGGYRLAMDLVSSELKDFQEECQAARQAAATGLHREALTYLQRAIAIHRGALFPPDDSPWVVAERELLHRTHLANLRLLAQLSGVSGEPLPELSSLLRTLPTDPLRDDLHRELLQTYQRCSLQ